MKVLWVFLRLVFYAYCAISVLSIGVIAWITLPIFTKIFFNSWNPAKFARKVYPILFSILNIFINHLSKKEYRKHFSVPIKSAPIMEPSIDKLILQKQWQGNRYDCNGCLDCCIKAECPMIDFETRQCMSYGSFFYKYFNCGRFPANQFLIEFYGCKKWEVKKSI